MFLQVDEFLSTDEVRQLAEIARQVRFVGGRRSNPHNLTKVNLMAEATDPAAQKASELTMAALQRCEAAKNFEFPRRMARPALCSYRAGMKYGPHPDASLLPLGPQPLRSDVSCTVFISGADEYVGGELVIYLGSETVRVAGKPGTAVFYPSTFVHEVLPVTSGERIVM